MRTTTRSWRIGSERASPPPSSTERALHLLVLPGDGIGPEITAAAVSVLERADRAFGLGLELERRAIGLAALAREGTTFPAGTLDAARAADGVILGPVSHLDYPPRAAGGSNPSAELRIGLDLYANIRPARSRLGLPSYGGTPLDLVIVRENTEGFYADRNMHAGSGEFMPVPDLALAVRKVSAAASARIARVAFALAARRRRHVTAVHKANVLGVSEAVFLREVRAIAAGAPEIAYDEQLVDAMAALLVRDGARFDVVVTTNMFGDILSDEASELAGGLGLAPSLNAGDTHAMAQAQHGSAPDLAGRDRANPSALILSVAMLVQWLARDDGSGAFARAGAAIAAAVDTALADPATRTPDLGGPLGTQAFADVVSAALAAAAA